MKNLDFPKIARRAVWGVIADSVNHLYVILLSEVRHADIADSMKNLQQSEKIWRRRLMQFSGGRYVRPIDS